jgi:DNA-binding MarR family transcriptional regulator
MHAQWEQLGLHRGQPFILHLLWEQDGMSHSELAARHHVRPATISNMIKRMERAGFVERRADPRDERVSRVYLTDSGHDVRQRVLEIWGELDADVLAGLNAGEMADLHRLLLRVRDNLLAMRGGDGP